MNTPDGKKTDPRDPELARRNIRTALLLAALALSFFATFFVVMSR